MKSKLLAKLRIIEDLDILNDPLLRCQYYKLIFCRYYYRHYHYDNFTKIENLINFNYYYLMRANNSSITVLTLVVKGEKTFNQFELISFIDKYFVDDDIQQIYRNPILDNLLIRSKLV